MKFYYNWERLQEDIIECISTYIEDTGFDKFTVDEELDINNWRIMEEGIKESILKYYPVTDEEREADIACQIEEIKPRY